MDCDCTMWRHRDARGLTDEQQRICARCGHMSVRHVREGDRQWCVEIVGVGDLPVEDKHCGCKLFGDKHTRCKHCGHSFASHGYEIGQRCNTVGEPLGSGNWCTCGKYEAETPYLLSDEHDKWMASGTPREPTLEEIMRERKAKRGT